MQLCGIKVYGYHNETITVSTGDSYAIDSDQTGGPYLVNQAGFVYKKPSSSWTKEWTHVA
jgi:hypothetical protein